MHLNKIYEKKTGKNLLVFVETYRDSNKKQKSRTVERIGYLEDFLDKYPDPISHFKEIARQKTMESKLKLDDTIEVKINKLDEMKYGDNDAFDIVLHYGDAFIAWIFYKLRLNKFIDARRKYYKDDYNLTNLFKLFLYERILNPSSKLENWKNRHKYYEKMDFTQAQVYAGLQRLGSLKESMLQFLNKSMVELYGRTFDYGFFDGTNVYYEIEDEDGLRMYGCSKENRKLPITQIGVMIDSKGFPISYDIYPGNTHDCTMLLPAIKRAREKFGIKKMVYVADKGFHSADNIANIILNHEGYVISNSVRGTKISSELRKKILSKSDYICFDVFGRRQDAFNEDTDFMFKLINTVESTNVRNLQGKKKKVEFNKMLLAYWSKKYEVRAKIDRQMTLEKAVLKSHSNSKTKIDNKHGSNAFLKTIITDQDNNIIENYNAMVKFDQEALDNTEALDGFYIIETNLAGRGWFGDTQPFKEGQSCRWRSDWGMLQLNRELTPLDIVSIYRGLWRIERSFRIMKSNLQMRPVYVWSKESIEGHFLTCFVSLLIMRILEKESDYKYSIEEISKALSKALLAQIEDGKYFTLYINNVIKKLSQNMKLGACQRAYTQQDLQKLFARTRKHE